VSFAAGIGQLSVLTSGFHDLRVPFNTTLTAGNYFINVWQSTASTGGRSNFWFASQIGVSQVNTQIQQFNTAASNNIIFGNGIYTTNSVQFQTGLPISAISSTASQPKLYFQLMNSTYASL
jgi:hypothetical protein